MADGLFNVGWLGRIGDTYNMLWKMVIRPPRDLYSPEELGPSKFRLGKRIYERRDLQLLSSRGKLECSHFVPAKRPEVRRPCVVYLHGNCSSRLEAFDALPVLLPRDLTVFCLDLSGSGRSDGEYISLGHHEEKDLRAVLQHLRSLDTVGAIGLWGRSMGATTSILRAAQDSEVAACVLDSAFRDLRTVAEELVSRGRFPVPQFMLSWAFDVIRSEVSSRAAFDPLELMPINAAPHAVCPAFFGVASDDTFVLPHHTQDLHNAWAGERVLRVFDGGHNGVRPTWFLEEAADFLADRLRARGGGAVIPIGEPAWSKQKRVISSVGAEGLVKEEDSSGEEAEAGSTPRLVAPLTDHLQFDADSAAGPSSTVHASGMSSSKRKKQLATELLQLGYGEADVFKVVQECSNLEDAVEWLRIHPSQALGAYEMGPPRGRVAPTEAVEVPQPPAAEPGISPASAAAGGPVAVPAAAGHSSALGDCDEPIAAAAAERAAGVGADTGVSAHSPHSGVVNGDRVQQRVRQPHRGARASDPKPPPRPAAPSPPPPPPCSVRSSPSSVALGPPGASVYQQLRFLGFSDSQCSAAAKRSLTLEAAMEWLASQRVTVHL